LANSNCGVLGKNTELKHVPAPARLLAPAERAIRLAEQAISTGLSKESPPGENMRSPADRTRMVVR
jgi:hypothetical protein